MGEIVGTGAVSWNGCHYLAWAGGYRTESGSDRILHSTFNRQARPQKAFSTAECWDPVATALGSVSEQDLLRIIDAKASPMLVYASMH